VKSKIFNIGLVVTLAGFALPSYRLYANDHATEASHKTESSKEGVSPEQSLKWLENGNLRFVKGAFRKDGRSSKDVQRLKDGQKPHAIVLSCSDSRVPPEHVFDQGLGEIFVVRTAGQSIDDNVIASIEYAVEHLGAKLIVVMGHTSCGAVKAAMGSQIGVSVGSPALDALAADIRPRLPVTPSGAKDFEPESLSNVKGVAEELSRKSAMLKAKTASGEVLIKRAMYHLDSGKVSWY
jgi:carbonic anhydrase